MEYVSVRVFTKGEKGGNLAAVVMQVAGLEYSSDEIGRAHV